MNWDKLERVVSRTTNSKNMGLILPTVNAQTAENLVSEFNMLFPKETLYKQIDNLQPEGWYHITEDCKDFGLVTDRQGKYIIYSTQENNFTKFIKSKNLLYTVF